MYWLGIEKGLGRTESQSHFKWTYGSKVSKRDICDAYGWPSYGFFVQMSGFFDHQIYTAIVTLVLP